MDIEDLRKVMEENAKLNGLCLNPDTKRTDMILKGLLKREKAFGLMYCPCRVVTSDPNVDADIVCPCAFRSSDIEANGICHCRLFMRCPTTE